MSKLNQNLKFGHQQHKKPRFSFIKITNKSNLIFKVFFVFILIVNNLLEFLMERNSKGVFTTTVA